MKSQINQLDKLPLIPSKNQNYIHEKIYEDPSIERRNAVIDEFLNNLENKNNNKDNLNKNENEFEEDEIDDFFKDAKILKKEGKNKNIESSKKIKRPKFNMKKISSLLLSDKNNSNHKSYALSFENQNINENENNDKSENIEVSNYSNKGQLHKNDYNLRNKKIKNKKLPQLELKYLQLRNSKISNHYLTSAKSNFLKSENKITNKDNYSKNNNSKWTNRKLLKNVDQFFSKDLQIYSYSNNLNKIRSKSHIGNRFQQYNNNLKIFNKDNSNLSPNLIAAQLYRNTSYFQKGLKRNYTAKINNKFEKNTIETMKNANQKKFKTLNNINNNSTKKLSQKNKSFRKLFNFRNVNFGINWINTLINKENKILNKNEISKKQLKLKLTELEANFKFRNDSNLLIKDKKYK